jgi:hypothetical protein
MIALLLLLLLFQSVNDLIPLLRWRRLGRRRERSHGPPNGLGLSGKRFPDRACACASRSFLSAAFITSLNHYSTPSDSWNHRFRPAAADDDAPRTDQGDCLILQFCSSRERERERETHTPRLRWIGDVFASGRRTENRP